MMHASVTVLVTYCATFIGSIPISCSGQTREDLTGNDNRNAQAAQFFLYTRNNRDSGQQIWIDNDESLKNSKFDATLMTKFVVHGWTDNHTNAMSQTVKNAFLDQDNYNVVLVDWGKIAAKSYPASVAQLKEVGAYVGKMIIYLENDYLEIKNLSIVGHSLGAHVVGLAARYVNGTIHKSVLHVVGLDPANPGFQFIAENLRIRPKDGDQVEIVHTNTGFKGLPEPVGDLDFYANGFESKQPGCGADLEGVCAHARSYRYYAEALTRPAAWIGIMCGSFVDFLTEQCRGNELAEFPLWTANFTRRRGTYMLATNSTPPFGLGLKGTDPSTYFKVLGF